MAMETRSGGHPVELTVEPRERIERVQVLVRLLLLLAIGALGCSAIYWALYLALPALAAMLLLRKGSERYLAEDAPRIVRVLRWFASAYGYLWLLTDVLPTSEGGPIDLRIEPRGRPTPGSALLRAITSLPALLLLGLLSVVGAVVWIVGAATALAVERIPDFVSRVQALVLRLQFRLVAYHLSLVDVYPSLEAGSADRSPLRRGPPVESHP